MNAFTCFAHRGASGHAPENTLMAVRKAIEMGAPWIEVDVYLVEGELVVIHDRRLDRTTTGAGEVTQQSFSYLRSLDAGKGEKIPLLREVFDTVSGCAGINVELKGEDTAGPVAKLIGEYVAQGKLEYDQVLVSAFNHALLLEVRLFNSKIPIGVLVEKITEETVPVAEKMGAFSIHLHYNAVTAGFVADIHRRGMKVFVYTVNRAQGVRRMKKLGVDGVFTNYPELCDE
ncbi:MAG: glycerophosphodiester phosphodiesterase family protein [Pseudomonadota bacterium]